MTMTTAVAGKRNPLPSQQWSAPTPSQMVHCNGHPAGLRPEWTRPGAKADDQHLEEGVGEQQRDEVIMQMLRRHNNPATSTAATSMSFGSIAVSFVAAMQQRESQQHKPQQQQQQQQQSKSQQYVQQQKEVQQYTQQDSPPPLPGFASDSLTGGSSPEARDCSSPDSVDIGSRPAPRMYSTSTPTNFASAHSNPASHQQRSGQHASSPAAGVSHSHGDQACLVRAPARTPACGIPTEQIAASTPSQVVPLSTSVRTALGPRGYAAVRAMMCRQQSQFTTQLFELHKLCQLQRLLLCDLHVEAPEKMDEFMLQHAMRLMHGSSGGGMPHAMQQHAAQLASLQPVQVAKQVGQPSEPRHVPGNKRSLASVITAADATPAQLTGLGGDNANKLLRPVAFKVLEALRAVPGSGDVRQGVATEVHQASCRDVAAVGSDTTLSRAQLTQLLTRDMQLLCSVPCTMRQRVVPPAGVPPPDPSRFRVSAAAAAMFGGGGAKNRLLKPSASLLVTWTSEDRPALSVQETVQQQQRPHLMSDAQTSHRTALAPSGAPFVDQPLHLNNTHSAAAAAAAATAAALHQQQQQFLMPPPPAPQWFNGGGPAGGPFGGGAGQQLASPFLAGHLAGGLPGVMPGASPGPQLPLLFGHLQQSPVSHVLQANRPAGTWDPFAGIPMNVPNQYVDPHAAWFNKHCQAQDVLGAAQQPSTHGGGNLAQPWGAPPTMGVPLPPPNMATAWGAPPPPPQQLPNGAMLHHMVLQPPGMPAAGLAVSQMQHPVLGLQLSGLPHMQASFPAAPSPGQQSSQQQPQLQPPFKQQQQPPPAQANVRSGAQQPSHGLQLPGLHGFHTSQQVGRPASVPSSLAGQHPAQPAVLQPPITVEQTWPVPAAAAMHHLPTAAVNSAAATSTPVATSKSQVQAPSTRQASAASPQAPSGSQPTAAGGATAATTPAAAATTLPSSTWARDAGQAGASAIAAATAAAAATCQEFAVPGKQESAVNRWWKDASATFGQVGLLDPTTLEPISDEMRHLSAEQLFTTSRSNSQQQRSGSQQQRSGSRQEQSSGSGRSGGNGASAGRPPTPFMPCGSGGNSGERVSGDQLYSGGGSAARLRQSLPSAFKPMKQRRQHSKHASNRMTQGANVGQGGKGNVSSDDDQFGGVAPGGGGTGGPRPVCSAAVVSVAPVWQREGAEASPIRKRKDPACSGEVHSGSGDLGGDSSRRGSGSGGRSSAGESTKIPRYWSEEAATGGQESDGRALGGAGGVGRVPLAHAAPQDGDMKVGGGVHHAMQREGSLDVADILISLSSH